MPTVELVWDSECPNVNATRDMLRDVLPKAGFTPTWREWRIGAPDTPEHAKGYGSPTVLVDGKDVLATNMRSDACCRVYPSDKGGLLRVPPTKAVVEALHGAQGTNGRSGKLMTVAAVAAAVLSSACCWLPLSLLAVGASVGGLAAFFESYRRYLAVAAVTLLVAGFYFAYLHEARCGPGEACAVQSPGARSANRLLMWIATTLVAVFALFPNYIGTLSGVGSDSTAVASTATTDHRVGISGMTCEACSVAYSGLTWAGILEAPGR